MSEYRLAPEWERQDAVIIVWPHTQSDWKTNIVDIEHTYIELSRYISRKQRLIIIAYDQTLSSEIYEHLEKNNISTTNITTSIIKTNDTWVRDYGPIVVSDNKNLFVYNFEFDAWGNKYEHELDNEFNRRLHNKLNLNSNLIQHDHIIEGGNIEINSNGELLTSKSCYKRNYEYTSPDVLKLEQRFREWFGADKVNWIDIDPLFGDDTDGHIDNFVRFCSDDIITYASSGHYNNPNNKVLNNLKKQLTAIKKSNVNNYEIFPLPVPDPILMSNSILPASYTNFLITNNYILVPVFNDKRDQQTLKSIDNLFPTHEVIDIYSVPLIKQCGGIHCATMQIPEGLLV